MTTDSETVKFLLFSDLHYKENMYICSVKDLYAVLSRADKENADFIISAGDLCNDVAGSPEIINPFLNHIKPNGSLLKAYNIYGNHELETEGNSMVNVTATLTNDKNVKWGTDDGNFNENTGYYYFDFKGFRFIFLDTNYSYSTEKKIWEHNKPASYGWPDGNIKGNSLGPAQLKWLESVLIDAAKQSFKCIVFGHDGFSGIFATSSDDAEVVRNIYKTANSIKPKTVLMSVNGHYHTNHHGYRDDVFYLDINTVRNGHWYPCEGYHYADTDKYMYEKYDDKGNLIECYEKPINDLYQSHNTWYFNDPLSAVITVSKSGKIIVEGSETEWLYGVAPENVSDGIEPFITSGIY